MNEKAIVERMRALEAQIKVLEQRVANKIVRPALLPPTEQPLIVKTVGTASAHKHAWQQQQDDGSGILTNMTTGQSGTAGAKWAYSLTGSDLTAGTVCALFVLYEQTTGAASRWLFPVGDSSIGTSKYQILQMVTNTQKAWDFPRFAP